MILLREGLTLTRKGDVIPNQAHEGVVWYKVSYKVHMSMGRVLHRRNESCVLDRCEDEAVSRDDEV
jgi:hypothetical protein